jgi:hypothetical protein
MAKAHMAFGSGELKKPLKSRFLSTEVHTPDPSVISGKKHAILFYFLLGDKCMPIKLICILIHNTREI